MVLIDELRPIHVCLCALYLRGVSRPASSPIRRWPEVERALRSAAPSLSEAPGALRAFGFIEESLILDSPGVLAAGEDASDQAVSVVSAGYPARWRRVLGAGAPPVLWGSLPGVAIPWFGLVGSRRLPGDLVPIAEGVAHAAVDLGYGLVSGGAMGADQVAASVAQRRGCPFLEILPHGQGGPEGSVWLAAPGEAFSTGLAMERNALIYAASEAAYVAHARLRAGGSWHGAADALRRRLTRVLVPVSGGDPGLRALASLGAESIRQPSELASLLQSLPAGVLFDFAG